MCSMAAWTLLRVGSKGFPCTHFGAQICALWLHGPFNVSELTTELRPRYAIVQGLGFRGFGGITLYKVQGLGVQNLKSKPSLVKQLKSLWYHANLPEYVHLACISVFLPLLDACVRAPMELYAISFSLSKQATPR